MSSTPITPNHHWFLMGSNTFCSSSPKIKCITFNPCLNKILQTSNWKQWILRFIIALTRNKTKETKISWNYHKTESSTCNIFWQTYWAIILNFSMTFSYKLESTTFNNWSNEWDNHKNNQTKNLTFHPEVFYKSCMLTFNDSLKGNKRTSKLTLLTRKITVVKGSCSVFFWISTVSESFNLIQMIKLCAQTQLNFLKSSTLSSYSS